MPPGVPPVPPVPPSGGSEGGGMGSWLGGFLGGSLFASMRAHIKDDASKPAKEIHKNVGGMVNELRNLKKEGPNAVEQGVAAPLRAMRRAAQYTTEDVGALQKLWVKFAATTESGGKASGLLDWTEQWSEQLGATREEIAAIALALSELRIDPKNVDPSGLLHAGRARGNIAGNLLGSASDPFAFGQQMESLTGKTGLGGSFAQMGMGQRLTAMNNLLMQTFGPHAHRNFATSQSYLQAIQRSIPTIIKLAGPSGPGGGIGGVLAAPFQTAAVAGRGFLKVLDNLISKWTFAVIGFLSIRKVRYELEKSYEAAVRLEDQVVELANLTGSDRFATATVGWAKQMATELRRPREEMLGIAKDLAKVGIAAPRVDTKGIIAAGLAIGDVAAVSRAVTEGIKNPEQLMDLFELLNRQVPQTGLIQIMSEVPFNDFEGRLKAVNDLLATTFPDTVARSRATVRSLREVWGELMTNFRESIMGSGKDSLLGFIKGTMEKAVAFVQRNQAKFAAIGAGIGSVVRAIGVNLVLFMDHILGRWGISLDKMGGTTKNFNDKVVIPVVANLISLVVKVEALAEKAYDGIANFFQGATALAKSLGPSLSEVFGYGSIVFGLLLWQPAWVIAGALALPSVRGYVSGLANAATVDPDFSLWKTLFTDMGSMLVDNRGVIMTFMGVMLATRGGPAFVLPGIFLALGGLGVLGWKWAGRDMALSTLEVFESMAQSTVQAFIPGPNPRTNSGFGLRAAGLVDQSLSSSSGQTLTLADMFKPQPLEVKVTHFIDVTGDSPAVAEMRIRDFQSRLQDSVIINR